MHVRSPVPRGVSLLALGGVLVATQLFSTESPAAARNTAAPKTVEDSSTVAGSIQWQASFEAALARAAAEEKPLMVDFETEWCGFCKKLDRETYGNEQVIRFVQQYFVAVKVDGDKRTDLRDRYSVDGYPTILFLSPHAVELKRIVGYRPPDDFLAEAGKAARSSTTLKTLKEEAARQPDDSDAQRAYARALFAAGNRSDALARLEAFRTKHPDDLGVRLDLGDFLKAAGRLDEACAQYEAALAGTDATRRSACLSLARTRLQLRHYEKSVAVLSDFLKPARPETSRTEVLEALFLRAYAEATLGDAEAALADLKAAEELDTEGLWGLRASLIRELVEARPEKR